MTGLGYFLIGVPASLFVLLAWACLRDRPRKLSKRQSRAILDRMERDLGVYLMNKQRRP